jgi:DNA polymerase
MMYFIKHFKLPISYLSKTKAQLAAHLLGGNRKGKNFNDEFQFPILNCIELKKYKHIADWYRNPENHNYEKSQKDVIVGGVNHTFSWGGGHGARKQFHVKGDFLVIDVTAYYPSLQKQYKFGYRVMNNPENFEFIHDSNVEFKRKGDKKARLPFKIMDNAISGQMKQKGSALYDPMSNNSICINGQLLLVDLIEHIEPYCTLIQNNTDGIIVKLNDYDRDFDIIDGVVADWEKRSGMKMDFDTFFGEIYQKDVNNYLLIDRETGAVKAKGGYVKKLSDLDYDLPILNKALSNFMIDGIPVETTINSCDDLKEFQLVAKISNKYSELWYGGSFTIVSEGKKKVKKYNHDGKPIKERCIRIFASKDENDGMFYKKKESTGSFERVQNCPEHSFMFNDSVNGVKIPSKLDKQWYINFAYRRLADFGVKI